MIVRLRSKTVGSMPIGVLRALVAGWSRLLAQTTQNGEPLVLSQAAAHVSPSARHSNVSLFNVLPQISKRRSVESVRASRTC